MPEPFIGEIRILSFASPPTGWALCNGQLLSISQNTALFSLLGTTYGGDGKSTFALPDFRGRLPMHSSTLHELGQSAGEELHVLSSSEIPAHTHPIFGSSADATLKTPAAGLPAYGNLETYTKAPAPSVVMNPASIGNPPTNAQPHDNMQPFLTLSFAIALQGVFPPRN